MIARSLDQAAGFKPCALTIGNFDGVHRAHRRLLRATLEVAASAGLRPAVLMFDPHPSCVVAPERAPRLLTSIDERCELIRGEGIEQILVQPFTAELARLTPEEFATRFLRDGLGAKVVIVGENFRFGCKQAGDTTTLKDLGSRLGFEVRLRRDRAWRGRRVSSGEVRKLVAAGRGGNRGAFARTALCDFGRNRARTWHRVEADRPDAEPSHRRASDSGARCVHYAN